MIRNPFERQLELEVEANNKGVEAYHLLREKAIKRKQESTTKPGQRLVVELLDPFVDAIKTQQEKCTQRRGRGRPCKHCAPLVSLPADKIAFITIRQVLNSCANTDKAKLAAIANNVADVIEQEVAFDLLKKKDPLFMRLIDNRIADLYGKNLSQHILLSKLNETAIDNKAIWDLTTKIEFGVFLIDLLIRSTGAFEHAKVYKRVHKKKRALGILRLSKETQQRLENDHTASALLSRPFLAPMVCAPLPWTNVHDGGYLGIRTPIVKQCLREHKSLLEKADLETIYRTLNLVQATPWQINREIFALMDECWQNRQYLGILPEEERPIPERKPADSDIDKESSKAWKRAKWELDKANIKLNSLRQQLMEKLTIAKEFLEEKKIYFPHALDWRGRIYPQPRSLHPQSDDTGRALLQFAEGKALGEHGHSWLKIHLANLFGENKRSFERRYQWVDEHQSKIVDSAVNPLNGNRFWTEAKKPWSFLAACFEWKGYLEEGDKWISHIPILMDGTCNGLQHYSALGRDLSGGKATNLVSSDAPQDIYEEVLKVLKPQVDKDAEDGCQEAIVWKGHLDREIVKRGVMTTPYGVEEYGLWKQIDDIISRKKKEQPELALTIFKSSYLGTKLKEAIGHVVTSAPLYMQWMRQIAKTLTEKNSPIVWKTPAGFVVYQGHMRTKRREIKTALQSLILHEPDPSLGLDVKKQRQGLPANFIHSLDAAHLMLTVTAASDEFGISSFAMIHDSYGVHACDWQDFAPLIRRTFADIYNRDILREFAASLIEQIPNLELPPFPPAGNLAISDVLASQYFFS